MSSIHKVFRNTGAIVLGNGIDALFGLAIAVLLAKYYGQSDFGKISFLGVFFFFLATVDSLWLRPVLIKAISRDEARAPQIVGNGMLMRGLVSLAALVLFWLMVCWAGISREMALLALLASLNIIFSPFIFSAEIVFRSCLSMAFFVKIRLANNLLTVILISFVILLKGNIIHFFIVSMASSIFLLLASKYFSEKLLKPVFTLDVAVWKAVFAQGWFLGLSAFFIFIYHRMDQVMLFHAQGAGGTGLYAAGVRLVESLQIIPLALMSSLLPLLSSLSQAMPDRFVRVYRLSFKYLLMFIIPVAVGASIYSQTIMAFFFGRQYVLAATAFSILMFAEIFVFLGIVNNTILVAANKQYLDPVFTGSSVVMNVVLNFVLIPKFGLTGAAVASLAAYATGPVMGLFIPATRAYSLSMVYYSLRPLVAALAMLIFIYLFHGTILIALFLGPVVYLLVLFALNSFNQQDMGLLKSFFKT